MYIMPNNNELLTVEKNTMDGIGDAIRTKDGGTEPIPTPNMRQRILDIPTGSTFYGDTFYDLIYGEPSEE